MKQQLLTLAALLHDIGKFRQRATGRYTKHQEHSYEFVNNDFNTFFDPCGDTFKNAILNHHHKPEQLQHLIEKQVVLADRLSASEREDEERETEDFVASPLASIMSRLKCAEKEHRYKLTKLNFERDTVIPQETVEVNENDYAGLWEKFKEEFSTATEGKTYEPAHYQTIVALLHKYTVRIPSATPWEKDGKKTIPDISLYDHLRTTAAIAACIGHELNDENEVDAILNDTEKSDRHIASLIKGDISGIQDFLYHIQSDGASNQLRGRSFYLQLLTEAIAHYVLKQFELPITNLILASGGHFFILAPYTESKEKLSTIRQEISQKLWELHRGDISCMLAGISIKARDFKTENFTEKWDAVSKKVNERKQQKWSELEAEQMFDNLFEPSDDRTINEQEDDEEKKRDPWQFEKLGRKLRDAKYLITYDIAKSDILPQPKWHDAINAFGLDVEVLEDTRAKPELQGVNTVVYRLGDTRFLENSEDFQSENNFVSYDFRIFKPVIAYRHDTDEPDKIADYNHLANASEGVNWFGALRMDVDNLGTVFKDKLENATISRHATLSREMRLFFEGYVPKLCKAYNENKNKQILELIYAGGDDLFLVGGWSALPDIAEHIRSEFKHFVTGAHVTLSGGIAIEHMKYPLYQFAERSGNAEDAAKGIDENKDAISFLQLPMKWEEFAKVREWHEKFTNVLTGQDQLPRDILTRLSQIYEDKERWAWRSLYYFHRLQERYKYDEQKDFLRELKQKLNHEDSSQFREELIHVITRWTALRIRNR